MQPAIQDPFFYTGPLKEKIGNSRKKLQLYKKKLKVLSPFEKSVAIGCLLGDASIQTQDGGKTYRLKFLQGDKNHQYLIFCAQVFSRWVLSGVCPQHRVSKKDGRTLKAWRLQTISHSAFKELALLILNQKGKKVVKKGLILNHLTPRGFAFWLMDDGGKYNYNKESNYKGITINTQGFTENEVLILVDECTQKFKILCWKGKNKGRWVVRISGFSYKTLALKVGPYIHPSMTYKFPHGLQLKLNP